jgi:CTP:molybdopterin cytidylyltransferase MocA
MGRKWPSTARFRRTDSSLMNTFGVVLAAGEGARFDGPKAPYVYEGERLVDRAVATLRAGGCEHVLAVLGAWVGGVPGADAVLVNREWKVGISTSLSLAIDTATASDADRLCILLVDLPGITPLAVQRVLASEAEIATATFGGEPSHPVMLRRVHWAGLKQSLIGDAGARKYLNGHKSLVQEIAIDDIADGNDLDYQPT